MVVSHKKNEIICITTVKNDDCLTYFILEPLVPSFLD